MAATYSLISSNVLTSSAASVTFSAIPSTYTDLVLRISARGDNAFTLSDISLKYNSNSSNYSETDVYGQSTTANSGRNTYSTTTSYLGSVSGATATSNTFGSVEVYIPSYAVAQNKPSSSFAVSENNASTANSATIYAIAGLWRDTTAVSSLFIYPNSGNFVTGSSFYLYGIKNS